MFNLRPLFIIFVALILLAGCQRGGDTTENGADGQSGSAVGTVRPNPIPVTFATLNADPFTFLNRVVRVTGVYRPAPPVGCFPFAGPQTNWRMIADGFELPVNGLAPVSEVAPDGLVVTIDGIWRKFEGPFGCGDDPPERTFWFLEANQLVSPNPLGGILIAQSSETTIQPTLSVVGSGTETPAEPNLLLTVTLNPTPSPVVLGTTTPVPTFTNTPFVIPTESPTPLVGSRFTPTVTPIGAVGATPIFGPTSTGTITATPTAGPGNSLTPNPTATLGSSGSGTRTAATPSVTETPSGGYPPPNQTPYP